MGKLIFKILLFFSMMFIVISMIFYTFYLIGGNDLPAPNYSNSISFNEKMDFIRHKDLNKIEYIVLGSSMSLNNIDSEIMIEKFGENYLNLASWGFKFSDIELFLQNMLGYFPNLKSVIISSNLMDYSDIRLVEIIINYPNLKRSLEYFPGIFSYFIDLDIKYLLNNSRGNEGRKSNISFYQSLDFDEYGGVVLNIPPDNIDEKRWVKNLNDYRVSKYQIEKLNGVIDVLKQKQIKLYITFSPLRPGSQTLEEHEKYEIQIKKIENELAKRDVEFINCNSIYPWNDSLYVDYAHLNKKGTEIYTDLILNFINKQTTTH